MDGKLIETVVCTTLYYQLANFFNHLNQVSLKLTQFS